MSLLLAISSGGYEIVCSAGSYTITGVAATLSRSYNVSCDAGSYALSGVSAQVLRGYNVGADAGAYSKTGVAATLSRSYNISCGSGAYSLSGNAAQIDYQRITAGRRYKKYGKGYLRRGNEVLVFESQEKADEYEQAELEAQKAISKAKKRKVSIVKPEEKISIQGLENNVKLWQMSADLPFILKTFDYHEMYLINQRIKQMQDEEDIEILLTM